MDQPSACILAGGKGSRFGSDKTCLRQDGRLLVERLVAQLHAADFHVTLLTNGAPHLAGIGDAILHDIVPCAGPLQTIYYAFVRLPSARLLVVAADMPFLSPAIARLLWTAHPEAAITHLEGSRISATGATGAASSVSGRISATGATGAASSVSGRISTSGAPGAASSVSGRISTSGAPGAASSVSGHLPGVYANTLVPAIRELLCHDERRLHSLLQHVAAQGRYVIPSAEWRAIDPEGHALININTPQDWAGVQARPPFFSV